MLTKKDKYISEEIKKNRIALIRANKIKMELEENQKYNLFNDGFVLL